MEYDLFRNKVQQVKAKKPILFALETDTPPSIDKIEDFEKIYDYIYSLLVNANVKKDPEILNQALDEIRGMRDTWKEVMNRTRGMNQ